MKTIPPIRPNAGIRVKYAKALKSLVKAMCDDMAAKVDAEYRAQEHKFLTAPASGKLAQDAAPVTALQNIIDTTMRRWSRRWNEAAKRLSKMMVNEVDRRTLSSLKAALRDAGLTVELDKTRFTNTKNQALMEANAALIRSIPEEYGKKVSGLVMRGITDGNGAYDIHRELVDYYGVTERRALFIARDQVNKATETVKRSRDEELGLTRGVWVHVPGVKTSRETHKKMNGREFILSEGLYDSAVGRKIHTGELPGCQCTYRTIIPEFLDK